MKNLHVLQTIKVDLDVTIVGQCIDADNSRILVLTSDFKVYEVQGDRLGEPTLVEHNFDVGLANLQQISPNEVILVEFIVEDGCILVALKQGQVIRIGVSSFSPPSGQIYQHPKEISSIRLSPDQDLIALADKDNDILILSSDWIQVYSSNALSENDSVHKPVGVGWGSKETQFFGLDGRPSKEKQDKNQVIVDEYEVQQASEIEQSDVFRKLRKTHERSTVIDWRGDGQFLATLTFIPDCDKHYLKVWNRNLELQYMSEQLVTMERGLLSWIPNGQYACCAQRRDVRVNEIAMFEKNGMVHQRVSLPTLLPHLYIQQLMWSPDSKILAIVVIQFSRDSSTTKHITRKHMIMLYTMQNFQYYLKYTARLGQESDHYSLRWNPIHHNILYIATSGGQCIEFNCSLNVDYCRDYSTVYVADANKLLLTPFDVCNIPPPMSAVKITFDSLITQVAVGTQSSSNLFVLTADNKLHYSPLRDDSTDRPHSAEITTCIDNKALAEFKSALKPFVSLELGHVHTYQNLTSLRGLSLLATRQQKTSCEIVLLEITDDHNIKETIINRVDQRQIVAAVRGSYHGGVSDDLDECLFLDDSSRCLKFDFKTNALSLIYKLEESDERLFIKDTYQNTRHGPVVSLTMDLKLRAGEHVIATNCTSFRLSDSFLVYTTADNLINFLPLDRLVYNEDNNQSELGSWNQPIENDGTLVLVSETDSKVILQMPRGNIEILHPRIMVLLLVADYLDAGDYISAMKLARRYRVDLNFLFDYLLRCDESNFYKETLPRLALTIAQNDPALLNLLITELSQEDTIHGRYASAMKYLPARTSRVENKKLERRGQKVNRICQNMKLPEDMHHLQPRLLCLLKQEPRKTGQALKIVHSLVNKDERDSVLKFVLYFVHVDQLFLDAISTYDTGIALMVATVSSRDPKEYLALLDGFKAIVDENLRKHVMNVHIKNYERAFSSLLAHLHESPDPEATKNQLVELMVSKRLYKFAICECFDRQLVNFVQLAGGKCQLNPIFDSLSTEVWTKYGDYLLEKRYYLEAGLAYSRAIKGKNDSEKKLDNVLKCFLFADDWARCLAASERYGLAGTKREDLLKRISANLAGQSEMAYAILALRSVKDNEIACQLVNQGSWHLAEVLADDKGHEQITGRIKDTIAQSQETLAVAIELEADQAESHLERLKELILTPQNPDQHVDMENCFTADGLSTVDGSEAFSVISGSRGDARSARSGAPSIATRTSSKSNKSQAAKRKKINLKKGSRYEDMALVDGLQKFVEGQKARQDETRQILAAGIEYNPSSVRLSKFNFNASLERRYELAREIRDTLWPATNNESNIFSVYKRFGKLFVSEEAIDNTEVKLLMRPEFPTSLGLLEFY